MRFLSFEIARSVGSFLLTLTVSIVSPYMRYCVLLLTTRILYHMNRELSSGGVVSALVILPYAAVRCAVFLRVVGGVYGKKRLGCFPVFWVVSVCAV